MADFGFTLPTNPQLARLKQQQALAELLMKQGAQQDDPYKMAGGLVVPQSPLAGLSKAAEKISGAYLARQAEDKDKELSQGFSQKLAESLSNPKMQSGVPALRDPATGQELVPAVAPGMDTLAAILKSGPNTENPYAGQYADALQLKSVENKGDLESKVAYETDPRVLAAKRSIAKAGATNVNIGPDLSKSTISKLEEKAMDTSDAIARLDTIQKSFKPEYLQLSPRVDVKLNEMKDFLGQPLDKSQAKDLEGFTAFRQDATTNLNKTIKDLTGATMGVEEAERIMSTVPNAGSGIFDGDSPTVFKSKLDNVTRKTKDSLMRANWAKAKGLDPLRTGIELQDVPALVEREGQEIEKQIRSQNPTATDEQVKMQTRLELGKKFGLR